MATTATAARLEASQLRNAAREHKRAAGRHRRQARELMQRLAKLEADCAQLGIQLHIDTQPQEGQSGNDQAAQDRAD